MTPDSGLPKGQFVGHNKNNIVLTTPAGGLLVGFWVWVIGIAVASAVVFAALSINGRSEEAAATDHHHGH